MTINFGSGRLKEYQESEKVMNFKKVGKLVPGYGIKCSCCRCGSLKYARNLHARGVRAFFKRITNRLVKNSDKD